VLIVVDGITTIKVIDIIIEKIVITPLDVNKEKISLAKLQDKLQTVAKSLYTPAAHSLLYTL